MKTKLAALKFIVALTLCHPASAQFFSMELLNLMNEAQRVSATGDINAIIAFAKKNPGFVKEITETAIKAQPRNRTAIIGSMLDSFPSQAEAILATLPTGDTSAIIILARKNPSLVKEITEAALKAQPGNRAAIIESMVYSFPFQAEAIALAAVRGAPPSLAAELSMIFQSDLGWISFTRSPGEVLAIAGKITAVEPGATSMIASAIFKAIGSDYAPNYAAIVARAAPQEAASIVEAVTRAAFQSTSVTPPGVVESIAVAVANVVPSQVAAIMTATTKFGFNHSVLVASALLQTAPNQTPSILPILQSSFQSRIAELGTPIGAYVNNRVTQQTVQAALSRAAVAVIAIPNPMIPAATQATTTPTTPVDPSINVSPSS